MNIKALILVPSSFVLGAVLPACSTPAKQGSMMMMSTPPPPANADEDLPVALPAGISPTPPMGWNSWNNFNCNVSSARIEEAADAIVASGMKDAGYTYINIDDCWAQVDRAADGTVQPTPSFPDGIKEVADYVHNLGLKLGIYSDRGTQTCAGRAGSQDHETQDATSYAAWGVDYLKYDNCSATLDAQTQYQAMQGALGATGRPIVFSLCAWRFYEWGVGTGNLWRTTTDIKDSWDSVFANIMNNRPYAAFAGPNGWNDPDMLEVGNGGMTTTEYQTHFSLWALAGAPLIAGNDPTSMSDDDKAILTNKEVIALNQDYLGLQGVPVRTDGDQMVWAKPLNEAGARGVVLLNAGDSAADIAVSFDEIALASSATVRDLVAHADLGSFSDSYHASVPSHGVATLEIKGQELPLPSGSVYLSDIPWVYGTNGLGPPEKDQSNGFSEVGDGVPISLQGTSYAKGLGVAAPTAIIYRLGKGCSTFSADVGIDDSTQGRGSVVFQVWADGEKLFDSGVMTAASAVQTVQVSVKDKSRLKLFVGNAGDGASWDRASWGNPKLDCATGTP